MLRKETSIKHKALLVTLSPAILLLYFASIIAGFMWGWLCSGFSKGEDIACKLSGFETNEEMINRIAREREQ